MRISVPLLAAAAAVAVLAISASAALAAPAPADGFSKHGAIDATLNGTTTIDSANAPDTIASGGPGCGYEYNSHVVWFKWKATESASITATTLGSSYDTVLYVYAGGSLIGCDDDTVLGTDCPAGSGNDHCSKVVFQSAFRKTYYFAVAAYSSGQGGDTHLNLAD